MTEKTINFENNSFSKRLKSMLAVDFRRMFTSKLFYIMLGVSFIIPILILVMTTMMDGSVTVNPQTKVETVIEGFDNVWQIIGTVSGGTSNAEQSQAMSMGLTTMCNINLMFFIISVFVCLFISDDFRSGYAKNLFTVRSNKSDYVISKTLICFIAGAAMLIVFFIGSMFGGIFSSLPFTLDAGASPFTVCMSMLSKIAIVAIFVSIYVVASVYAKQRLWLSLLISFAVGMIMFMMIPIITPLNSGVINLILCLVGAGIFSVGLFFASKVILEKTSII